MAAPKNNKFAIGNSGKPKQFSTVKKLEERIIEYFNYCDLNPIDIIHPQLSKSGKPIVLKQPRPYTVEGLAEYLGTNRQTLHNYEKQENYEEYFDAITRAKEKINRQRIELAMIGVYKEGFTKFLLINSCAGYSEKVEQKNTNTNINYNTTLTPEETKDIAKALESDY